MQKNKPPYKVTPELLGTWIGQVKHEDYANTFNISFEDGCVIRIRICQTAPQNLSNATFIQIGQFSGYFESLINKRCI